MALETSDPTRRPPARAVRVFPWLVAAASLPLLVGAWRENRRQAREIAALNMQLLRARPAFHHPGAADARYGFARRPAAAAPAGALPAILGVAAMDHLDGRRDDPLYAPVWHKQQQRIIEREYDDTLAALHLPDTAVVRLRALLTARREAAVDASDLAQQFGIEGPEAKLAVKQSVDALTDEIRQQVGSEEGCRQLEMAPAVSQFKSVLEGTVAVDLAAAGDPLSGDQLYALARDYVASAYDPSGSPVAESALQDQDFLARAGPYLNASQVAAVREFLGEEQQALRVARPPSSDGARGD